MSDSPRRETLDAVGHLRRMFDDVLPFIEQYLPSRPELLDALPPQERLQLFGFLRLFEQLHDIASRKLFRLILIDMGEEPRELGAKNLVRRLEKLGAISSADAWFDLTRVRNALVHDYPLGLEEQAARLNEAHEARPVLIEMVDEVLRFASMSDR